MGRSFQPAPEGANGEKRTNAGAVLYCSQPTKDVFLLPHGVRVGASTVVHLLHDCIASRKPADLLRCFSELVRATPSMLRSNALSPDPHVRPARQLTHRRA